MTSGLQFDGKDKNWADFKFDVGNYVGAVQARKNCLRLVEAFEHLPGDPLLVIAGGAGFQADEVFARIDLSPARGRIRQLGYVDADVRAKLYRTATALAFPSLDEGFGLPILEAMASGAPVITSDAASMPEVAGDAALLIDPTSPDALAAALGRLHGNTPLQNALRIRGLRRAEVFSWDRSAERMLDVYASVVPRHATV